MLALKCEICGGKLTAKSGGIFECEYCGLQYDKTRVQEMVQEIKGTVKVEGTVDVRGTVKIDGPVSTESSNSKNTLLNKARRDFEALNYLECYKSIFKILDIDPECSEAHILAFCCTAKCKSLDELPENVVDFDFESIRFKNAIKYGNPDQIAKLENWKADIVNRKNDDLNCREKMVPFLEKRREEIEPFYDMFSWRGKSICVSPELLFISPEGKINRLGSSEHTYWSMSKINLDEISKLKNINRIEISSDGNVFVLDLFGNVYCLSGKTKYIKTDIINDGSAINIATSFEYIYILKKDGSLIAVKFYKNSDGELSVYMDRPLIEFSGIEKLLHYACYFSCLLCIDKNKKVIKLGSSDYKTLPDDYDFSFYNSSIKKDGTHIMYDNYTIDNEEVKKSWRNVIDYIEKRGEKCRNKRGSVVERKSAYILLGDGTIDFWTYGFFLDSTTEKLECSKVARIFDYYDKGIIAVTDDCRVLTIEGTHVVSEKKLYNSLSEYKRDRAKYIERAIVEHNALMDEKTNLENSLLSYKSQINELYREMNNLYGLFTGGKKRELQSQIDNITRLIDKSKDRIKVISSEIYKEEQVK